jgi:DNA adenine methylase
MAAPFLKWAGGKAKLAPLIVARAPQDFRSYHEPFLGAGAVFFALCHSGRIGESSLADANGALIECFEAVRDDIEPLIAALERLEATYLALSPADRRAFYYEQRACVPASPISRAARLIFLNKTCYNGLYRVNGSGLFNVPHGRYANPRIVDPARLREASTCLASASLAAIDFAAACDRAQPGDFVYLDPPYQPLSATSSFTGYTREHFGPADQARLRDTFDALTRRGVAAMLSNSDHPAIRELYEGRGYRLECVAMSRAINSVGSRRTPIPELLISNW